MKRIALVSTEPIRPVMGGIGIRYAGFAKQLPELGFEVVLICLKPEVATLDLGSVDVRPFRRGGIAALVKDCDVVVVQGQFANDVILAAPSVPVVIDLYDPWLVENLHYASTLGYAPYRNDHASWVLQLGHGDFFLCSSQAQRLYYLGFLTALGRVNPDRLRQDPDLNGLIAVVPFGISDHIRRHVPYLQDSPARRILFGGLYDWYDPWTLLRAVEHLAFLDWEILFMHTSNPAATPQALLQEVEAWCRQSEPWKSRVKFLDWVPVERRFDLLHDVDVLAAPHTLNLETQLSMRTRFLDALAVGCPVVMTEGDALSAQVKQYNAGWTVPPEDPHALAEALNEALTEPDAVDLRRKGAGRLAAQYSESAAIKPLVQFCRNPRRDETKEAFAYQSKINVPGDDLKHRLRRYWMRWRPR